MFYTAADQSLANLLVIVRGAKTCKRDPHSVGDKPRFRFLIWHQCSDSSTYFAIDALRPAQLRQTFSIAPSCTQANIEAPQMRRSALPVLGEK